MAIPPAPDILATTLAADPSPGDGDDDGHRLVRLIIGHAHFAIGGEIAARIIGEIAAQPALAGIGQARRRR